MARDGKMMAVPVNAVSGAKPTFEAGAPVALFATAMLTFGEGVRPQYQYDVTADGTGLSPRESNHFTGAHRAAQRSGVAGFAAFLCDLL